MSDMFDLLHFGLVLSVPFMLGVVVGRGFRRPEPSLEHRFGDIIKGRILSIYENRQFIGDGFEISSTLELDLPEGRRIEVIVREVA